MRKRERENPCFVCGHYHKFEDGEVCGICGHRLQEATEKGPQQSAFSTEILPAFLYLGSYDNASRVELLKAQGITRILNTVPSCQNLYKNSFTYFCLKDTSLLPLDECLAFIEQSRKDEARVLVHCMSGQNRSPAVVIAYLMWHKRWRLPESYHWVKERRPSINLTPAVAHQLKQYDVELFGGDAPQVSVLNTPGVAIGFGYPNPPPEVLIPTFNSSQPSTSSRLVSFSCPSGNRPSSFIFAAQRQEQTVPGSGAIDQSMDTA